MAKRRFQSPEPKREGNWWYLLYWQDEFKDGRRIRIRKRVKLAPATVGEREVQKMAAEQLRPMNQGLAPIGSAVGFKTYVDEYYKPTILPLMSKSTQARYESVIHVHLEQQFGDLPLRDLTPLMLQRYFSAMAGGRLSHESRDKIRDVLSSILASAVRYGLLVKNSAEGVRLPPARAGVRNKPYVTPQQFAALVEMIAEPYSSMVYTAVFTGLRVSELIGLRWRDIHESSITVDESCWRGNWGPPKSAASNATVPVNRAVIERILRLKILTVEFRAGHAVRRYPAVRSDGPEDLVFQSPSSGGVLRDNNVLVRHIKPPARKLGLPWVNWQVLRRSFATWLKMAGADVKDAQALMRHSRASTTLDVYQQCIPESQERVVALLTGLYPARVQ